jgi:hypothetical protein
MPGCAGSSSRVPAAPGLLLALVPATALLLCLGSGCAARRPGVGDGTVREPGVATPIPVQAEPGLTPGVTPPAPEETGYPALPGADRVYPSQDPRNRVNPEAPEAFPLGGVVPGPVAAGGRQGEPGQPAGPRQGEPQAAAPGPATESAQPEESEVAATAPASGWSVQLLASASAAVARERAGTLAQYFEEAPRVVPAAGLFRVRVGHCATRDEAERLRRIAVDLGLRDAFVVTVEAGGEMPR